MTLTFAVAKLLEHYRPVAPPGPATRPTRNPELTDPNPGTRDRRHLFQLIRNDPRPHPDVFFPQWGFSLSEFAVWHILNDRRRKQGGHPSSR